MTPTSGLAGSEARWWFVSGEPMCGAGRCFHQRGGGHVVAVKGR
jgi:hypothetical protein